MRLRQSIRLDISTQRCSAVLLFPTSAVRYRPMMESQTVRNTRPGLMLMLRQNMEGLSMAAIAMRSGARLCTKGGLPTRISVIRGFFFLAPTDAKKLYMHNNVLNDALNLDVGEFCHEMISAVRTWMRCEASNSNFQRNMATFLKRHRGGLAPYIVGVDVFS